VKRLAFSKPKLKRGHGCRISNRDEVEKQKRGYTDPRSFVRLDGSEVLHGKDWILRKQALGERSGGRCEWQVGVRCPKRADDPHHIVPRSVRRDDRLSNLMALCRYHHDELDNRKVKWMAAFRKVMEYSNDGERRVVD
jgi:hypothetical protein